jgi:HEAT repeat protein
LIGAGRILRSSLARCVIVLAIVSAVGIVHAQNAQPASPSDPAAAPSATTDPAAVNPSIDILARDQAKSLTETLKSEAAPQANRDEAARRLALRDDDASREALMTAIQSANPGAQLAVARALSDQVHPDPQFVDALFPLLEGDRQHAEAAGRALGQLTDATGVYKKLLDALISPSYSDPARAAVARAMGTIIEQRAANALMDRITDAHEHPAVKQAAADALLDMTGLESNGTDPAAWQKWWQQAQRLKEPDFRQAYLAEAVRRRAYSQHRLDSLIAALGNEFDGQFHALAGTQRDSLLMRLLGASEPELRTIGAILVTHAVEEALPVPTQAREQLRWLVGDSSPQVRRAAAEALAQLNDPKALNDLLAQLAIEHDPNVKAALALALTPIGDIRGEQALEVLLTSDQSDAVVRAAAGALGGLGATLRREHPNDSAALARRLRDVLRARTGNGGDDELRAALVEAMVPLRDQEVLRELIDHDGVLNASRESNTVRAAAVRALGELTDRHFADTLVRTALDDPSPDVRRPAVQALQNNPAAAEQAEPIFDRLMSPATEPDPSVRDAAWQFEQGVLDQLAPQTLSRFAQFFKDHNQIDRQVIALQALVKKLASNGNPDDLGSSLEDLGDALVTLDRFDEAVAAFKQSLDIARNLNNLAEIDTRSERELDALLRTGNYAQAIDFAQSMLKDDKNQPRVRNAIKAEAERLIQTGHPADIAAARDLVNRALHMTPSLRLELKESLEATLPAATQPAANPGS